MLVLAGREDGTPGVGSKLLSSLPHLHLNPLEVTPYENPDLPNKEGSDYSLCSIIYYSVT